MARFNRTVKFIKETFSNNEKVYLHEPQFIGNEKTYLADTIDSTFVSSVGEYVNRVEREVTALTQTEKAIAVVNGTAALQVCLKLAGVKTGDEVLTQALSFVATANAIAYNGALPVFIDVDKETMGLSPDALKEFLKEFAELKADGCYNLLTKKKIAACVPMHTFGFMCRINELKEVCDVWKIPLIEDAAEAIGSKYNGQSAGSFGLLGALSFNGNKLVTAGGGGAIVTNHQKLAELAKHLTTTAKVSHPYEYLHDALGYNFRMPNLNAALLCAQLEQIPRMINRKKQLYHAYSEHFKGLLKPIPKDTTWNYWLMSVQLADREERNLFLEETNKAGVMTRPIWTLLYKLPMYQDCQKDDQKNAQWLEDRVVNIPSSAVTIAKQ